nr:MAG TPA: hypothetical protein [Caudoviricetes sp.]DAM96364.1 MAG TPA: hypothetical protein [Caudoviricetes sp.]
MAHRNEQENLQSWHSGGFRFTLWNFTAFLSYKYNMPYLLKSQP